MRFFHRKRGYWILTCISSHSSQSFVCKYTPVAWGLGDLERDQNTEAIGG